MPRTLVTGGAGFVGSHLVDWLVGLGHRVVVVDNFVTGSPENLSRHRDPRRVTVIEHDVAKPLPVTGELDYVYHLASPASPRHFVELAEQILRAGAHGTINALEVAEHTGARFVLASTSEVYGDPEVHPQPESYLGRVDSVSVRGVYDEAKRFAEAATMAWYRKSKVDVRIARIFNTYGPRMPDDGRVLSNFMRQALRGEPLTIHGDGLQTRSFCHVSDLVGGLVALAEVDLVPGPVNLGNPDEVAVLDLAREVIEVTESSSDVVHLPPQPRDPKLRRPDISRATAALGWEPQVRRREGLRDMVVDVADRIGAGWSARSALA